MSRTKVFSEYVFYKSELKSKRKQLRNKIGMRYGSTQDEQHGGTNPISRGMRDILRVTHYIYGNRNIRQDKDIHMLPMGKASLERVS